MILHETTKVMLKVIMKSIVLKFQSVSTRVKLQYLHKSFALFETEINRARKFMPNLQLRQNIDW